MSDSNAQTENNQAGSLVPSTPKAIARKGSKKAREAAALELQAQTLRDSTTDLSQSNHLQSATQDGVLEANELTIARISGFNAAMNEGQLLFDQFAIAKIKSQRKPVDIDSAVAKTMADFKAKSNPYAAFIAEFGEDDD